MAGQKKTNSKKNTDSGSAGSTSKKGSSSKKDSSSAKSGSSAKKPAKENKRTIAKKKSFLSAELKVIAAIVLGGFMLLTDIGLMGSVGAFLLKLQRGLFGQGYFLLGIAIVIAAIVAMKYKDTYFVKLKVVCVFGLLTVGVSLIHIIFSGDGETAGILGIKELYISQANGASGGGVIGGTIANLLKSTVGYAGAYLVLVALLIVCIVVITEKSFVNAAKLGASKTAEAVKTGAGKTVEAAKYGQERAREIHRENVIRRDAKREEKRLRQLEDTFPGFDMEGTAGNSSSGSGAGLDIALDTGAASGRSSANGAAAAFNSGSIFDKGRLEGAAGAGLGTGTSHGSGTGSSSDAAAAAAGSGIELTDINSMRDSRFPQDINISDMRKEAARAEIYANYGRDIIGDGQPGLDSMGEVKSPLFGANYTNTRSTEGVSFDTEVIDKSFDLVSDREESEAVNIRAIDYDSDEVPFEETTEDRYKSYAHILESGELNMDTAKRAGFAVNTEPAALDRSGFKQTGFGPGYTNPQHLDAFKSKDAYGTDGTGNQSLPNINVYGEQNSKVSTGADEASEGTAAEFDSAEAEYKIYGGKLTSDDLNNNTYTNIESSDGFNISTNADGVSSGGLTANTTAGGKELDTPDNYEASRILREKGIVSAAELNAATSHGNIGTYTSNGPSLDPTDKLGGSVLDSGLSAAKGLSAGEAGAGAAAAGLPQAVGNSLSAGKAAMASAGNAAGLGTVAAAKSGFSSAGGQSAQSAAQRNGQPGRTNQPGQQNTQQTTPASQAAQQKPKPKPKPRPYVYPRVNLLEKGSKADRSGYERLRQNAVKLQNGLRQFGVGVTVTNITVGPRVSRYELTLDAGVRVSKLTSLTSNIMMMLAAKNIRIEAPIPGKSAVGIEVPNEVSTTVKFRDILESEEFKNAKSRLSWGVGLDIGGNTIICDISKMPHILVSGTTGSGKSVGINSLIMSILYRATPQEVRMILVDPKQVEFTVYNGIPHLLTDVVTTPERALSALNWAVAEMNRRYKLFQDSGTRNIKGYNEKIEKVAATLPEEERPEKLPFILIIIDELSELMMHAKKDVEACIVSLAQLARAAGIHLVVATQRPSVDVVTGLIKSNIPSRVAFKLPSVTDSRTILDSGGAEALLGNGDMLYKPGDKSSPVRVQGAFLSDDEVENVVSFIKKHNPKDGANEIDAVIEEQLELNFSGNPQDNKANEDDTDEYFADAGRLIITSNKASIGGLQRKFKIGFNRAARIMDQLCEAGVVSDGEGTKERRILMSMEEFEAYLSSRQT